MGGLTLAQAEQHLSEWLTADTAVAKGQAYSIGGRTLTRANANEIRENIKFWQSMVDKQERQSQTGGIRHRGGVAL